MPASQAEYVSDVWRRPRREEAQINGIKCKKEAPLTVTLFCSNLASEDMHLGNTLKVPLKPVLPLALISMLIKARYQGKHAERGRGGQGRNSWFCSLGT